MSLIAMVVVLAGLAFLFSTLELFWPSTKRRPLHRKGVGTDLLYWFLTPTMSRGLTLVALVIVVSVGIVVLGQSHVSDLREHLSTRVADGYGPLARQPLVLVVVEMLLLSELLGCFIHRRFHRSRRLWKLHAVHHSSEDLDWLSAVRVHPLNTVVMRTLAAAPLILLGFPVKALAIYLPSVRPHLLQPLDGITLAVGIDGRARDGMDFADERALWARSHHPSLSTHPVCTVLAMLEPLLFISFSRPTTKM